MAADDDMRTRAKDHLPSVLLTLLSIVQALALQLLWDSIDTHAYLYNLSWLALLGWIQIGATLLGIVIVWLIYTSLALRFRWVPSSTDSVFPFVVGILEYMLIAALGVDRLGRWFLVLGLVFAVMTVVSQLTMRRARLDGENEEFFTNVTPATLRNFVGPSVTVLMLAGLGIYLQLSGDQGWFALVALLAATVALSVQYRLNDRYWRRSVGLA